MISILYALYDKKLTRYMTPPLVVRDDAEAIATVQRAIPENILPDIQLEKIATFDDKTAELVLLNKEIIPMEVQNG